MDYDTTVERLVIEEEEQNQRRSGRGDDGEGCKRSHVSKRKSSGVKPMSTPY
jgi:hypothetical protein